MLIGGMSNNYIVPTANVSRVTPINTDNTVESSSRVKPATECETCQSRKYVDGSNENNVSFKTPGTIKPQEAYSKVSGHEREHVSNAIAKGNKPGARLVSATVSMKTGVCPECGRVYIAGGETNTTIKYSKNNPYDSGRKTIEGSFLAGNNFDATA